MKEVDALISFSMFVKSENALADSIPLNSRYIKYYVEHIASTARQIVPAIM